MEAGKGWSSRKERRSRTACGSAALILCLLSGCALTQPPLDRALLADGGSSLRGLGVCEQYLLGCPDVVEVKVIGRPDLCGCHTIGADGRIALGPLGRVRVEGLPVAEAAHAIADDAHLPPERVRVDIAAYNSQQIYLFGEVAGLQRAVPYEGPETVVDLLQRTGGITPGAAPGEVHVVRTGVAEGKAPRVFHIDLEAIVRKQDQRTNLRLQAFDQIYVGETRKSCFAKFVPPCFRELYDTIFGLSRTDG